MMTPLKTAEAWATIIGTALGILSGLFYIVRWIVLWMWRVNQAVVNHIPHMEKALKRICKKMDIVYDDEEE